MKKIIMTLMCAAMLVGSIATGHAEYGEWRGGIRERIHHAEGRIERGVDNGSLTRHEARRLREELDRVRYKIDHFRQDGHVDEREREIILRDLDRLDRDISREKHDDQRRDDYRRHDDYRRYR